jgi:hypothetical protein
MKTVNIFYCYAHKDKDLRDALYTHLSTLRRKGLIREWYDGEILPGTEWNDAIADQMSRAEIILLLVSPDFIASDYCYEKEVGKALERHEAGVACVIPILLRPVDWEETSFSKLQMLPIGAKAITLWPDRDEAFDNVARGVRKVVTAFLDQKDQTLQTSTSTRLAPQTTHTSTLQKQVDSRSGYWTVRWPLRKLSAQIDLWARTGFSAEQTPRPCYLYITCNKF